MKSRKIAGLIVQSNNSRTGRIVVLTGARQTGKTTLIRHLFPDYEYLSIEDPVMRGQYAKLTASQWKELFPMAILDEVQKKPVLIESIKSVYDQWPDPRYLLLGSSQLLLLKKVKESLAGRCVIHEFFPLTLPELRTSSWDDPVEDSLFQKFLLREDHSAWLPSFVFDRKMAEKQKAWDHYLLFGAYPAVSDNVLSEDEKYTWLKNYVRTYLERDIRDLASFRDLEPFIQFQRYLAINTGCLINASSIANRLGMTYKTVQRYIRYLEISYQAVVLPAWSQNESKRLSRMPKIHFMDNGVCQAVLQKKGGVTGKEFESLIIAEIYKQIANINFAAKLFHLRTYDGKEVDLIIEMPDHYLAFEIKMANTVSTADVKNLRSLKDFLNKPLKQAFVLSNDIETKYFDDNIVALNAAMFLG